MDDRIYVATCKGLFAVERVGAKQWTIVHAAFVGDNVSAVLADRRDAWLYAALEHGHFGAKLHRSRDGGVNWEECAVPVYPRKPGGVEDLDPMCSPPPSNPSPLTPTLPREGEGELHEPCEATGREFIPPPLVGGVL